MRHSPSLDEFKQLVVKEENGTVNRWSVEWGGAG
jgi:hypothetical protein